MAESKHILNTELFEIAFENEWMYIGLHKRGEANFSKWVNDAPLTYTDYLPGQPEFGSLTTEPCYVSW
jgi:hypothetical protein